MVRDITRDVARGLTVLEMETVNQSTLPIFGHAAVDEYSITYADTVFPNFAFLAGMTPISPKRSVALVGLGLAYNSSSIIAKGPSNFKPRFVGVLQRTGLSSLILNALPSFCPTYQCGLLALWTVLTVGGAANKQKPFETVENTAQSRIDRAIFGSTLYKPEYDPEGLLGAIGTAMSMWFGYWYEFQQPSTEEALKVGSGVIAVGGALSYLLPQFFPISKPFWTPSFVFVTAGYNILKQTAIKALVPHLPECVSYVLSCLGKRSIEIFFTSALVQNVSRRYGIWEKCKSFFAKYIGETGGDLAMLVINNSLMAFLATLYVKHNLRIRF